MYATVEDLRSEGISLSQASDERLLGLLEEAGSEIDRITGWFFSAREKIFRLNGRGTRNIEPPAPPIAVWSVTADNLPIDPLVLDIVGCPVSFGFCTPRIALKNSLLFPQGMRNIEVHGIWGYTEDDGTSHGRTPLAIKRACMLLVRRHLPSLGDVDGGEDARNRFRVIEEKTRDQSYKLSPLAAKPDFSMTGDPEIDSILGRYRKPTGLGTA